MNKQRILIVGFGYFGSHLAKSLDRDRYEVHGTTRFSGNFGELVDQNVVPIELDVVNPHRSRIDSLQFESIVYCVGFDRGGKDSKATVYVDGLRRFLSAARPPTHHFVYVSSTGVYGQKKGEWITEDAETRPERESGQICLRAENVIRETEFNCPKTILRFAGIYGPNRVPNLRKLMHRDVEDTPIPVPANSYLNLIHVSDAAEITRKIIESDDSKPGDELYLVADGSPVDRRDFYREAARLGGLIAPGFREPTPGEISESRGATSKRISNQKLIEKTNHAFRFPTFREGLEHILRPHSS